MGRWLNKQLLAGKHPKVEDIRQEFFTHFTAFFLELLVDKKVSFPLVSVLSGSDVADGRKSTSTVVTSMTIFSHWGLHVALTPTRRERVFPPKSSLRRWRATSTRSESRLECAIITLRQKAIEDLMTDLNRNKKLEEQDKLAAAEATEAEAEFGKTGWEPEGPNGTPPRASSEPVTTVPSDTKQDQAAKDAHKDDL